MRHMLEVAVGVRIMQRSVFPETLPVIRSLHSMQHAKRPQIRGINQVPVLIEIESPRIAPSFAEEFEPMRDWMIAPDPLLKFNAADMSGDCAPLAAVKPAVRPPRERVRDRMRI